VESGDDRLRLPLRSPARPDALDPCDAANATRHEEEENVLMRFDPFRELDRLTHQLWGQPPGDGHPITMPMDAYRRNGQFVIDFDLPGVDPGSIDLTVEKNVLTVTGQRTWQPGDEEQVVVSERPQGRFSRQLFLGEGLDTDSIAACYDHGVLTVTIPVAEEAKSRKVAIANGGQAQAITTGPAAQ
jgi:HSP20 family protein